MPRRVRPAWRSCLAWVVVHPVHFGCGENQLQQRRLENIGYLLPAAPETRRAATRVSGSRHARYARMQPGRRRSAERSELRVTEAAKKCKRLYRARPPTHVQSLRTTPSSASQRGCAASGLAASGAAAENGASEAKPRLAAS